MDDNWRMVIIAVIAAAPGCLAAWHSSRARKEMNGELAQRIAAEVSLARAETKVEVHAEQKIRDDELRGSKEDRKVP